MSREMKNNIVLNSAQHFSSGRLSPRLLPERTCTMYYLAVDSYTSLP